TLHEVNAAAESVYEVVDPGCEHYFGAVIDDSMEGDIRITVIATGFDRDTVSHHQLFAETPQIFPSSAPNVSESNSEQTNGDRSINAPNKTPNRIEIPDFLQKRRFPRG
ncbi:MAG: cell division protein FtsZ, partial [Nostocaceae cyanobacterium CSU_2_110]|nr:cell division protein FtsZ [Nostocaceae cyanobacterium CSU_2_110]